MARVIIFDGGDGGGLILNPDGSVRPIPPWDPAVTRQLRAISTLLQAARGVSDPDVRAQLDGLSAKLSNLAVTQVEGIVGPIDAEGGLVYQDDDGGFTCGSTGKPPLPFPWPAQRMPSVEDLITFKLVDEDLLGFVNEAAQAGADLGQLLSEPSAEAKRLGIELPERIDSDLRGLGVADPESLDDPVDREVVSFFHQAVRSGAPMEEWAMRPFDVASQIGFDLSPAAADRIVSAGGVHLGRRNPDVAFSPVAVAIVVVIVIVVWDRERRIPVLDRSGIQKF